MPSTISEALQAMRSLRSVNAGRPRGIHVNDTRYSPPTQWLAQTPQPWYGQLHAAVAARHGDTPTNPDRTDEPEYLVLSDATVVVVVTATARIVLPDYPLSTNQVKHQRMAVDVLRDLHRYTLCELADRRGIEPGAEEQPAGTVRVAPATDPTNARWIGIDADLDQARCAAEDACRTHADDVLILAAVGYGGYARQRHRLDLAVLSAMHQVADRHQVDLSSVGDWLAAEGAITTDVAPAVIVEQFAAAYVGPFRDQLGYVQHRMTELGWADAVAAAGIPDTYLDTQAMARDWFSTDVRQITTATPGRIEVFRRWR